MKNYVVDLCCGTGGWTDGFLDRGFKVIGFDIWPSAKYRGRLVLQDVRTLDGKRFRDAAVIVASPPCDEFSRFRMPWTRKRNPPEPKLDLVQACFRIAQEADVPIVLENVREAQRWLGRAPINLGPFYLWGNGVPPLLPRWFEQQKKERYSSRSKIDRARIPFEIATWIADCTVTRLL